MLKNFQRDRTALIIANGELPSPRLMREAASAASLVICADGAANQLVANTPDLIPSVIVGDLDSITPEAIEFYSVRTQLVREVEQDSTDLDKAIRFAQRHHATQLIVVGVKGARLDHAITNIHVLHKYSNSLAVSLLDDDGYGFFLHPTAHFQSIALNEPIGTPISLIPLGEVRGITTEGLQYPLLDDSLNWAGRSGQSNRVSKQPASITLAPCLNGFEGHSLLIFVVTHTKLARDD